MYHRPKNERGGQFVAVPPMERFQSRFVETPSGCWQWSGTADRKGYGKIRVGERGWLAHRWAYVTLRHPVPDHLTLDHLCRNPGCVNPWHLEAVASGTNTMRGETVAARNAAKERCPRGHEYTRLIECGRSRRRCMTCQRVAVRDCMRRKRLADRIAALLPPEPTDG